MRTAGMRRIALAAAVAIATAGAGVAGASAAGAGEAARIEGRARVVDGDTLDFGAVRVRLHGVDAPETAQTCAAAGGGVWACGAAATARLTALAAGATIACEPTDRDRYGRIVAVCSARGRDLGGALVAEGLAWAFLRYADDYAPTEAAARAAKLGVWQAPTLTAWDYRDGAWRNAAGAAPTSGPESGAESGSKSGCPIKGNISRAGERIYHTPWSRDYERVRIDTSRGERWFCDEAAAQASGWRPPR